MPKVATTAPKSELEMKLGKLSEEMLRDFVLKISAFVVTPPQRLNVILSSKPTMVSYLVQNEKFFEIAGVRIPEDVVEESTVVSTTTISADPSESGSTKTEGKKVQSGFGIKKQYSTIYKKTYLNPTQPVTIHEEVLDDKFSVSFIPLAKTVSRGKYEPTDLYLVNIEYDGKKSALYDLQRKSYIFTLNDLISETKEILSGTYEMNFDLSSKVAYFVNGLYYVFLTETTSTNQYVPGIVIKNSYSAGGSPSIGTGVMNNVTGVFLPFSIQKKVEMIEKSDDVEELVKSYISLSRAIDSTTDGVLKEIEKRTKSFVKDITAMLKKAKEVEKMLLPFQQ